MANRTLLLLLFAVIALALVPQVQAFGAGNIPDYAYLEGKAFRHGDIEDILESMVKKAGGGFLGLGSGAKFSGLDIKRVYFGNWLRDYSQAIDIASLKKTNVQSILNLLMALGFMTFGYATAEFEITEERIGAYLPVEHIDNPKGYGGNEDPRKYNSRLRPPVDPRELEIDPHTGMKNYIANENGNWDTSKALIRRTIEKCIHHARLHRAQGRDEDEYEAYRLLGQALHTIEDFTAHSNFCELALIFHGYRDVFPHVGRDCKIKAPNGSMVHPLVTGTFGGSDFMHSMLGEAGDHLSEASLTDLSKAVDKARSSSSDNSNSGLRALFSQIPGGEGESMSRDMDDITRAGQPGAGGQDPSTMTPQQLHDTLWKILVFRDKVMKGIENTIARIPGLSGLIEKITNSLSVFVLATLEPYLGPILKSATGGLSALSEEVINDPEQFAVFENPQASDPTHSFASKDHFGLILNEPAGMLARINIKHAVLAIVAAWDDNNMDPRQVADAAWEGVFHPNFASGRSQVQQEMLEFMKSWIDGQGRDKQEVLNRLTAAKVRSGDNRRIGDTSTVTHSHDHATSVPAGGLQGMLSSNNVHVPGAQYLNMGQDLLAGKMPGSAGFGQGSQQGAWRGMPDESSNSGYQQQAPQHQQQQHHQQQSSYNQPSYNEPPQHHQQSSYEQSSNYNQPPSQQSWNQPPPPSQWNQEPPQQQHYQQQQQQGWNQPQQDYQPQHHQQQQQQHFGGGGGGEEQFGQQHHQRRDDDDDEGRGGGYPGSGRHGGGRDGQHGGQHHGGGGWN
ncbi:heterokaryon incompatibility protein Het-C-domain-containing protein [Mrakia frigida]|uniref:heterokaryon incompatibility protein Het-C-domain-containing protein n=1 Tax=Mrakia frigida TaxID=29902 RepID=UPI003FCC0987